MPLVSVSAEYPTTCACLEAALALGLVNSILHQMVPKQDFSL